MNLTVKENIEKAQAKQKEHYDRKHTLAYTITCSLGKGLYRLADVQTGAVIHRVNGFHLKLFCGGDVEQNVTDDAKQKDDSDGEPEDRFVGVELEDGLVAVEPEATFVDLEQDDGLDELKDGRWLSCDVINHAQSLLKSSLHSRMGYSPLIC